MKYEDDKLFSSDTRNGNDGNSDKSYLKTDELEWIREKCQCSYCVEDRKNEKRP